MTGSTDDQAGAGKTRTENAAAGGPLPLDAQAIAALAEQAVASITKATSPDELDKVRVHYLGRQGEITRWSKGLGAVPADLRPAKQVFKSPLLSFC